MGATPGDVLVQTRVKREFRHGKVRYLGFVTWTQNGETKRKTCVHSQETKIEAKRDAEQLAIEIKQE